jgi:hypothetical protein
MKLDANQKQHWHAEYGTANRKDVQQHRLPFARHLQGFRQIATDAKKRGITIINACPDSAIKEFPKMSVKEVLEGAPIPKVPVNTERNLGLDEERERRRQVRQQQRRKLENRMTKGNYNKRWDWVIELIKSHGFKEGAEVGVHTGMMTSTLLRRCPRLKLYAIDNWWAVPPKPTNPEKLKDWVDVGLAGRHPKRDREMFTKRTAPFRDRLTVLYGDSVDMAEQVGDNTLDFVFIDADHQYHSVIADLKAWVPKVKDNIGVVCGHDYAHPRFPGVTKAVIDAFGENHEDVGFDGIWRAKKEDFLL